MYVPTHYLYVSTSSSLNTSYFRCDKKKHFIFSLELRSNSLTLGMWKPCLCHKPQESEHWVNIDPNHKPHRKNGIVSLCSFFSFRPCDFVLAYHA